VVKKLIVVIVSLVFIGGPALAPGGAVAASFHGRASRGSHVSAGGHVAGDGRVFVSGRVPSGGHGHSFVGRPFPPPAFSPRHFFHHRFRHRFLGPFIPFWGYGSAVGSTILVYAPAAFYGPSGYHSPPVYYDSPAVYNPSMVSAVAVAPVAPPPPMQNVIEYPTGRYELRGDGTTTPYAWVWIPNPPAGPPSTPPGSGDRSVAPHGHLYRWIDGQGVLHMTDRLEAVPQRYRDQAKQSQPS